MAARSMHSYQARDNVIIEEAALAKEEVFANYDPSDLQLYDLVEDCTGFKLSEPERRLVIVAFEQGRDAARRCIWYDPM